MFRIWDFGKIQISLLFLLLFIVNIFLFSNFNYLFIIIQLLIVASLFYNSILLIPYTPLYNVISGNKRPKTTIIQMQQINLLSVNVYQYNTNYNKLISLIYTSKPDLVLTMESNKDWENALSEIENEYPFTHKVSLENTYGMHFYSKLKIIKSKTNYFVADDIPSFEINLMSHSGEEFVFFGVHPPPPSPTEEANSKERDGELLSVAKKVKIIQKPIIVCGDFNNVAWSKSSRLFKKMSNLIDPRIGLGFISTFHAKYRLLRFPIDLFFHSKTIIITQFKTLENINSDHFPVFSSFYIDQSQNEIVKEKLSSDEKKEVTNLIKEGRDEQSDR
jgi:endonuclease/exonuclease/phosphatase (EEP) superfamily protein YafD